MSSLNPFDGVTDEYVEYLKQLTTVDLRALFEEDLPRDQLNVVTFDLASRPHADGETDATPEGDEGDEYDAALATSELHVSIADLDEDAGIDDGSPK